MNGKNSGAYFTFNTAIDNEITYQISISFVSIENAKESTRKVVEEKAKEKIDEILSN